MKTSKDEIEEYTVYITKNAENDLNEIRDYISQNSPLTSLKILERIQERIKTLDHFPGRGGYVPELLERNIKDYRQLLETPWKIIYKLENKQVNILTITDSRRNVQDILIKKLIKETG
jgi:plasmid stabilization system protein ParE